MLCSDLNRDRLDENQTCYSVYTTEPPEEDVGFEPTGPLTGLRFSGPLQSARLCQSSWTIMLESNQRVGVLQTPAFPLR